MVEVEQHRDRHEITQDIGRVHLQITTIVEQIRQGETPEQIGDAPGRLLVAANELLMLADEWAEVWPQPAARSA